MFRYDLATLVLFSFTLVLIGIIASLWIYYNNGEDNPNTSNQLVVGFLFVALLASAIAGNAMCDQNHDEVQLLGATLSIVPIGWAIAASTLGYVSNNK